MNKGLQALIGVACVVVIVAAGLWGFEQYSSYQQRQASETFSSNRAVCLAALHNMNSPTVTASTVSDCRDRGYVTAAEISNATGG